MELKVNYLKIRTTSTKVSSVPLFLTLNIFSKWMQSLLIIWKCICLLRISNYEINFDFFIYFPLTLSTGIFSDFPNSIDSCPHTFQLIPLVAVTLQFQKAIPRPSLLPSGTHNIDSQPPAQSFSKQCPAYQPLQ